MEENRTQSLHVRKVSLVEAVIEQMQEAVQQGRFLPGEKIPSEKILTQEFGVSRTTLREAFKRLESMGTLTIKQGDGTYLSNSNTSTWRPQDEKTDLYKTVEAGEQLDSFGRKPQSLSQYLEAREMLELAACDLAVEMATEEDIARLRQIVVFQHQAEGNSSLSYDLDFMFHRAIIELSNNSFIIDFWFSLSPIISEQIKRCVTIEGVCANAGERHEKIIDALAQRDETLLRTLMAEHIRMTSGRLFFDKASKF